MIARIKPGRACGEVTAPASKSMAHRLLIAAAMGEKLSTVRGISYCEDVLASIDCLRALGASITLDGDTATVTGFGKRGARPSDVLNCRESGSTLRFLIPIASLSGEITELCGSEYLMGRPLSVYEKIFAERGMLFEKGETLRIKGPLMPGEYRIPGNISSQFITGLLFALPTLDADSRIIIDPPFESRSYAALTIDALNQFGVDAYFEDELTVFIPGNQKYQSADVEVEGDYSGSAFTEALGLLGGEVTVTGLSESSKQGDRIYREYYALLKSGCPTLSVEDCPDLAPVLMALAAALNGATLVGTARLAMKESDRGRVMAKELRKLGASVAVEENRITVHPCRITAPTERLCGHNDHRIVMSLSLLLTLVGGEIDGASAITKSYPDFFLDLERLGIEVHIL